MRRTFSLQMLFGCWYIIFSSTKLPDACKQKIWFLITQEKYAALCKNIAKTQLAHYFWASAAVLKFGVPFTPQLLQSARNITPSWGTPEAGMCHIITMLWDSQHCLSEYPLHPQKFACSYIFNIFNRKITFYQTQVNGVYSRARHVESNLINLCKLVNDFEMRWNAELWRLYRWKACNILEEPAPSGSLYFEYKKLK